MLGHLDNLRLLCGYWNPLKGNRPMEYLGAGLVRGRAADRAEWVRKNFGSL